MDGILNFIKSFLPTATYTDMPKQSPVQKFAQSIAQPVAQAVTPPVQAAQPQQQGYGNYDLTPDNVRAGILRWAKGDTTVPILQHVDDLVRAGKMMPQGVDPLLPTIMAIRETQGGRDLADPAKRGTKGENNVYDIRGTDQNGNNTQFINYPDFGTATFGGTNSLYGGAQSGGFTGLINGGVPGHSDIYADFRKSGDMKDFFNHYSPPADKNGALDEQVNNYNYIRNTMTGDSNQ